MPKYKVYALTTTQLVCEIDADNYEQALSIADYELITDDFKSLNTDFTLGDVMEII